MTAVYHGTVTGKDDLFLESFIITGAVSNHSFLTPGQRAGFFVSLDQEWMQESGYTDGRPEKFSRGPNSSGHGLMLEFDEPLNPQTWDFDHEMGYGDSMRLVIRMEEFLPKMKLAGEDKELIDQIIDWLQGSGKSWYPLYLHCTVPYPPGSIREKWEGEVSMQYPVPGEKFVDYTDGMATAHVMQKVHDLLKRNFPDEYAQVKQETFDAMVREKSGMLKYIGETPLKVSRIYLSPEDYYASQDAANWQVIYEASGKNPALAVQQAKQAVAKAPVIS